MERPTEKRTASPERIYKILHRNLDIEEHEPHKKTGIPSDVPQGQAAPASLVATVV